MWRIVVAANALIVVSEHVHCSRVLRFEMQPLGVLLECLAVIVKHLGVVIFVVLEDNALILSHIGFEIVYNQNIVLLLLNLVGPISRFNLLPLQRRFSICPRRQESALLIPLLKLVFVHLSKAAKCSLVSAIHVRI